MLPNPEVREVTLDDYIAVVRKRWKTVVAVFAIIPAIVTVLVFAIMPVYRATASVLIEKNPPKITKFEEVYQQSTVVDLQFYQTQYKILSSRTLAERVFDQLRLGNDKDFQGVKDPIAKLVEHIKIEPLRNSQVALINVYDTDALRAASIANALANAYIHQDIETRNLAAKEAVGWLDAQLVDIKSKMKKSQEALGEYIKQNRIVSMPSTPDAERKMKTLLEDLKDSKSKTETELAEALKRYKEKHPKIIALRAELENINSKIETETNNILDLNQKMIQYNALKQEVESNQQLCQSLLQRAKETDVSEKIEASRIRIIDTAKAPNSPAYPKRLRDITLSIFFALFCSIGVAMLLEYLDSTIHNSEDIRLYVNLPFLGYISSTGRDAKSDIDKDLLCHKQPSSIIAETYRVVRTAILFASPEDEPSKSILVTSSLPQEGKTLISLNLAQIFAQAGERVILIDVDMRRPRVHKPFNIEQKKGLSDFLVGEVDLKDIIKPTSIDNLSVITSGTIPPNPSELLHSAKVRTLLDGLKTRFDRILLDSPPILSVADTSLLANMVDGVVLVIKGASTHLDAIAHSKSKIQEAKGRIIGVVLNNIEAARTDKYYYFHYYAKEAGQAKKT